MPEHKGPTSQQLLLLALPCTACLLELRAMVPLFCIVNMYIYIAYIDFTGTISLDLCSAFEVAESVHQAKDAKQKSQVGIM